MKQICTPRIFLFIILQSFALIVSSQNVNDLKLKDYRPVSIYKTPVTKIEKASHPMIDFHSHDYPKTDAEVDEWVRTMDEVSIAKSIILPYSAGVGCDSVIEKYSHYKNRFEVWCGFDYSGFPD